MSVKWISVERNVPPDNAIVIKFSDCIYPDGEKVRIGWKDVEIDAEDEHYMMYLAELADQVSAAWRNGAFMTKWGFDRKHYCVEWSQVRGTMQLRLSPV